MGRYNGRVFVTAKEIENGAIPVDSKLDLLSENPVSNRAVAEFAQDVTENLADLESSFEGVGTAKKLKPGLLPDGVPTEVDDKLSATSTKPVQNKVVHAAIGQLQTSMDNVGEAAFFAKTAVEGLGPKVTVLEGRIEYHVETLQRSIGNVGSTVARHENAISNLNEAVGDVDAALDAIIALQNNLIGGDGE